MDWTTLTAAKTTAGSIASWSNYSRLDTAAILEEAQSLIYSMLRVREMRTTHVFSMAEGNLWASLPTGYLDPIELRSASSGRIDLRPEGVVTGARWFNSSEGSLGSNPFTTTLSSQYVSVAHTAHEQTQGSIAEFTGATAVGGLTLSGSYPVTSITSANAYVVDAGSAASSAATGGGASVTYVYETLEKGWPSSWAVFNEKIQFDQPFDEADRLQLMYYKSPTLLSASNTTNFLTNRWPRVLRKATQAIAADFMKDTEAYNLAFQELTGLVQNANAESDLGYRGAVIEIMTP